MWEVSKGGGSTHKEEGQIQKALMASVGLVNHKIEFRDSFLSQPFPALSLSTHTFFAPCLQGLDGAEFHWS